MQSQLVCSEVGPSPNMGPFVYHFVSSHKWKTSNSDMQMGQSLNFGLCDTLKQRADFSSTQPPSNLFTKGEEKEHASTQTKKLQSFSGSGD